MLVKWDGLAFWTRIRNRVLGDEKDIGNCSCIYVWPLAVVVLSISVGLRLVYSL